MMSFGKDKMVPIKAALSLMIVADHLALFYGVSFLKPFIQLGPVIVSVFFFISGFGLYVSYHKSREQYLDSFFRRRIFSVLLPLLLTTLLFCVFFWPQGKSLSIVAEDLIVSGIPVLPFSWFAIEILVFYLLFFISFKCFAGQWKIVVLFILSVALIICFIWAGYSRAWWVSSLAFPTGVLFAANEQKLYAFYEKRSWGYWLSLIILAVLFLAAYLTGQQYVWTICYVCIPLIIALIVARIPLEKLSVPAVSFLAMVSYEVYLCQGIAMELLRGKIYMGNDYVFAILVVLFTILLAWVIHLICKPLIRFVGTSA